MQGLSSLEELNIRRNRIRLTLQYFKMFNELFILKYSFVLSRSTAGLEVVPTLEKLYMSNNELQVVKQIQSIFVKND